MGEQAAELLGGLVGLPDRGQVVAAQELGEDLGVDLVGLDLGLGDGASLERVADDDAVTKGRRTSTTAQVLVVASRAMWSVLPSWARANASSSCRRQPVRPR